MPEESPGFIDLDIPWRDIWTTSAFRGQIYEYDTENPHVKDFLQCHFHRKIMRDALLPTTRRMGLCAANQVGKTRIGELIMMFKMVHQPADMILYDITDIKSRDRMHNRTGDLFSANPDLGEAFRIAREKNRHDISTQDIKLPGMILRARPLNETWTQSFPTRYGMVSDCALDSKEHGQLRRLFVRSTQFRDNEFWFLESQGGLLNNELPDDNWTEFMATTNDQKLYVRCQFCGTRQRFIWSHDRTVDTLLVPPLAIPSLDHQAWLDHHRPILTSRDRAKAGFKHGDGIARQDDDTLNEREILRTTHYECLHCGSRWDDTPEMRQALDRQAGLDESWTASRPNALPGYLGYSLPIWINPKKDIKWGDVMLIFKRAIIARKQGNWLPLQEFYTKYAGEHWDSVRNTERTIKVSPGSYDPVQLIENESDRDMAVDCQEDKEHKERTGVSITGWFWYVARIYDKSGNSKQLARGFVKSVEDWIAVQKHWKIPNDRVVIDVRQWPDQVKMLAAKHREERARTVPHEIYGMQPQIITWKLYLTENNRKPFNHRDGKPRHWSPEISDSIPVQLENGKFIKVPLKVTRFNKLPIMQQLDAIRSGGPGMPKFEVLSRAHLRLPNGEPDLLTLGELKAGFGETGFRVYEEQMNAQRYDSITGKYEEVRPDDHYSWAEQALLVRKGQDGFYGLSGVFEQNE